MPAERHPLWGRLPPVPTPTPEQLARVRQAVEVRAGRPRFRRLRWTPGVLLGLGFLWWLLAHRAPDPVAQAVSVVVAPRLEPALVQAPPVAPPQTPDVTLVVPAASVHRAIRPAVARAAQGVPAAAPVTAPVVAQAAPARELGEDPEASLLGQALARLRHAHDPQGALEVLATYRQQFPQGALHGEAILVQAESLARLGRHAELVAMLNPEAVGSLPRSTELQLLRAEALANLDRCDEAIPIFSEILAAGEGDVPVAARLRERALFGRALCRANRGQSAAARRDLALEEEEFPEQAEKVHQALRRLGF